MKKLAYNSTLKNAKIKASSPITSWQIDGENVEAMTDFIFLASIITVDGDCSHEIRKKKNKKNLLLGGNAMTMLDSILKSKDIYCADQGPYSQSFSFSSSHVQM